MKNAAHVTLKSNKAATFGKFICKHCDATKAYRLPQVVTGFVETLDKFIAAHRKCKAGTAARTKRG